MSYFNQSIRIFANRINYHLSDREGAVYYDPSTEPRRIGDSVTSTNSGGETTNPRYDLVDNKLGALYTLSTNGLTNSPNLELDTFGNITFDATIIANHNLNTAGATITVKYSATPIVVTASYSGAQSLDGSWQLSSADSETSDIITIGADGTTLITHASRTGSSVKIDIDDVSTYSADITIGELCFCHTWTAPHAPDVENWQDINISNNSILKTQGGQKYGVGFSGGRRAWSLTWTGITTTVKDQLDQIYRITNGSRHPFWIDLGEHATLPYLRYVRFTENQLMSTPLAGGTLWAVTLNFEEEI